MAVEIASNGVGAKFASRLRLPDTIPPFGDRLYNVYRLIWYAAFLLALVGPVAGLYQRWQQPSDNSGLMLGSRIGVVLSESDATLIRFPVGPVTTKAGIKAGDRLAAIDGFPLPQPMPFTPNDIARHPDDAAYILLYNLLQGGQSTPVQLTVHTPGGATRQVQVITGDQHIAAGARALWISPALLSFIDLLHVVTYPFLLIAAWFLHKRQARDPVSCILSLAILLTMSAEQPSATFLEATVGVPRPVHVFLYDMGNICLLSGILLFPHGKLSVRLLALLAALPVLLFLHGDAYRGVFMIFMLCAVLMLVSCLRRIQAGDVRQQIKWALFGFSGYAFFLAVSLVSDMVKVEVGTFGVQLLLEMGAGLSLGLAFLSIQMGLLVALLRFRLYDAEFVISRSATLAAITLILGAIVAGVIQALGTWIQNTFGANAGAGAAGVGAAIATVLISPVYERVQRWMEQRFHKDLLELKNGLPDTIRDLREVASLPELLQDVLLRVRRGVQTLRAALVVDDRVQQASGVSAEEAQRWYGDFSAASDKRLCDGSDPLFRVRVPLCSGSQSCVGWLLVGPRPDGSSLGNDERDALVEIADPITRAIRIVVKRDAEEREVTAAIDECRRRIEMIEHRLGGGRLQAQA